MSESTPEQSTEPAVEETPSEPSAEAPKETPKANVWDDPASAKAEIERLRRENAKDRTDAKAQAADGARTELAQTIGKALGLVAQDEPIDPAKLTESLTAAQAEAKQAQVALAVYQNAAAAGGDPVALLDSSSFLRAVSSIDATDGAAIGGAIKAAIEANPRLAAAALTPKTPAPNPAQGGSASGSPTAGDLAAQAAANGDWQQAAALKAEQLMRLGQEQTR